MLAPTRTPNLAPLRVSPALLAGTAAVFGTTWVLRWLTVGFTNDHFVHLARARQMLFGEWPLRDFFDAGLFLQYVASAAMLAAFDHKLFGEALLTVSAVATGTALTFYLAARLTDSLLLALAAAILAFEMFPRLYGYPKVLFYVVALLCAWRYIERPTVIRLTMLALVTTIAFLFRHDHGVYIAVAAVTAILIRHARTPRLAANAVAGYVVAGVLLVSPFLVYLQVAGGVGMYLSQLPRVDSIARPRLLRIPFAIDGAEPLVSFSPPSAGHVYVRWQPGVDEAQRRELEQRYHLRDPVQQTGGWRYDIQDGSPDVIGALIHDPAVADTAGIDRASLAPEVHYAWLRRLRNATPLLRLRLAPGLLSESNALAWLYYVTTLMPFLAGVLTVLLWRRTQLSDTQAGSIATLALMCVVMNQGLIRESPDSRLADVAGPAAIMIAAVTTLLARGRYHRSIAALACVFWTVTIVSGAIYGRAVQELAATRILAGPAAMWEQLAAVDRNLHLRPIDYYAPPGASGLAAVTRYLFECTEPSDRVLVTWFAPEVPFYSERLFAGGQAFLDPGGWHSTAAEQELAITRLRRQHVPIVLLDSRWEAEVTTRFPLVFAYLHREYEQAARASFGDDHDYVVLASKSIVPAQKYVPLDLPCYR